MLAPPGASLLDGAYPPGASRLALPVGSLAKIRNRGVSIEGGFQVIRAIFTLGRGKVGSRRAAYIIVVKCCRLGRHQWGRGTAVVSVKASQHAQPKHLQISLPRTVEAQAKMV